MSQAVSGVRAFDQAGDVRDHKRSVAGQPDDAKVRNQRREGIVGNLRPGSRDSRDHRRLARIGEAYEPDIREQLEVKPKILFFPGKTGLRFARRSIGGRGERGVAVPSQAALRDEHPLAVLGQVRELDVPVVFGALVHGGARRHLKFNVVAVFACTVRSLAVAAAPCGEGLLESVVEQRVEVAVGDQEDRAARTAVAAARSAPRDELLAAEGHCTPAAVASCDVDIDFVYKHAKGGIYPSSGMTLITRPRAPWSSNLTFPSIFANSVSSFPSPTFNPGRKRRPRCRTRIDPPLTILPS